MLQQRQQRLIESEAVTQKQIAELFQHCEGQKSRLLPTVDAVNANLRFQRFTHACRAPYPGFFTFRADETAAERGEDSRHCTEEGSDGRS